MIKFWTIAAAAVLISLTPQARSAADDDVDVQPGTAGLIAHGIAEGADTAPGLSAPPASTGPSGHFESSPSCALGGSQTCAELRYCPDGQVMTLTWFVASDGSESRPWTNCDDSEDTAPQPQLTVGMIAQAFRRVPLPASQLQVQPPGGETLVNFATNFYTERGELTRVVRLLGRRVELRISPATFTWRFGDGTTRQTSSPGSPYPALDVTHEYQQADPVQPRVDTTYTADYRVGAGGWQPVPGTVTIPGATVGLDVREATPTLVSYE